MRRYPLSQVDVYGVGPDRYHPFDVYVSLEGEAHCLYRHRAYPELFDLLQRPISLPDLRQAGRKTMLFLNRGLRRADRQGRIHRIKARPNSSQKLERSILHIQDVVTEFMTEELGLDPGAFS